MAASGTVAHAVFLALAEMESGGERKLRQIDEETSGWTHDSGDLAIESFISGSTTQRCVSKSGF
jgi:hypothetical protein